MSIQQQRQQAEQVVIQRLNALELWDSWDYESCYSRN